MSAMNDGSGVAVLRKFGINESFQLAMYMLDQYRGTCLSCRYIIPPRLAAAESRMQLEKAVKVAVVDIIMRHPMLQVGMMDVNSKTPSWIQLETLNLAQHIKWTYTGDHDFEQTVRETFCSELDGRFPDLAIEQPGWTMTVLRQGDAPVMEVLLTWNHPQFDGAGGRVLHEDFLEMLNADNGTYERAGLDGDILRLPQDRPLLPTPIERLKSLPVDLKYLAKVLWEETRPQFLNRDPSLAVWCPIRPSPYKTQFRTFLIDEASMLTILTLCRQNKTTITGLLQGLVLIAFSYHLDSTAAPAFQTSTIIDHRRNLPPAAPDVPWVRSDRAVANYVTQLFHKYGTELVARIRSKLPTDASQGRELPAELLRELWDISAQNRQAIVNKLEAGMQNDLLGLFKFVKDWQQTMRDMAKKKRQFSWIVTNIGVLDGKAPTRPTTTTPSPTGGDSKPENAQRWSIERAQFGLSTEVPAAAMAFSPVTVAGRGMCVSASWPDCAVDVALAEGIMADLERWLVQLARQS